MIPVGFDYATPSALQSDRERALLGLTADTRRPVRFRARVREGVLSIRLALQALGELIWSDDSWLAGGDYLAGVLDPVVTVHHDRVFFEAFSQDQSAYGLVIADRGLFETEGEVACGTTNVDFTAWLWAALAEMRSSRKTWLRVEAAGLEVTTAGAGGRFERKVDLPEAWVRGFLQLQAAMAMPGTRLEVRPVDLLAAIRFLRYTKAKVSPRALRYEFPPGEAARVVLEPWEHVVPLKGSQHSYTEPRTIRTWGRRRLRLIEPLLPYADGAEVYLKGRALPSFYAVRLGAVTFVLGLSGWTESRWSGDAAFDLLTLEGALDTHQVERARQVLAEVQTISASGLAERLGVPREVATRVLARLCRDGRAIFDVQSRHYRHRELFDKPIDHARIHPPDPRAEEAARMLAAGRVAVESAAPSETRKMRNLPTPEGRVRREVVYRNWQVKGRVAEQSAVEVVLDDSGRAIFGTCGCPFFEENLLNLGPCAHMIALVQESAARRRDLPTSVEAPRDEPPTASAREGAGPARDPEHDVQEDEENPRE